MRIRLAAAFWLAAMILPAAADSRDEARERMARCEDIGQTRQYLDCLYAALQPLRADLGLPPAPQAPTYAPLFASTAPTRVQAAREAQSPQAQSSPGFFTGLVTGDLFRKGTKVAPDQFGLRNAKPGRGENVDHIIQPVTSFTINSDGLFQVTLANGQVWTQVGFDEARAQWKRGENLVATIGYGASGTFNLSVGDNTRYKVRRIK